MFARHKNVPIPEWAQKRAFFAENLVIRKTVFLVTGKVAYIIVTNFTAIVGMSNIAAFVDENCVS